MNIIYFLMPLALTLAGLFVLGFAFAAARGQYDDLETPAHRILLDDETATSNSASQRTPKNRLGNDLAITSIETLKSDHRETKMSQPMGQKKDS